MNDKQTIIDLQKRIEFIELQTRELIDVVEMLVCKAENK